MIWSLTFTYYAHFLQVAITKEDYEVTYIITILPTYYNSIENDIKGSNSLHLFKTKLKKNLYMNY